MMTIGVRIMRRIEPRNRKVAAMMPPSSMKSAYAQTDGEDTLRAKLKERKRGAIKRLSRLVDVEHSGDRYCSGKINMRCADLMV